MLRKLKSLFIIEEEISSSNVGEKSIIAEIEDKNSFDAKESDYIPQNEDVTAPEKFVNSLLKAIDENNLEGFDYLEYKQSLKSLESMQLDEAIRFNSAFAMAKTMGANKKNLLASANHYVKVLDNEKSKFLAAYEKQQEKQVISRQEKLTLIELTIQKKEEQIKKLEEEIKKHKVEFENKKNEINAASAKVALTRDQFFAAYQKVNDQILKDIERMNKYLTT